MSSINLYETLELVWQINIPDASKRFDFYITKVITSMEFQALSINELKDAFVSLKINKSPDHDGVSFNVIKKCFVELCEPLKHLFNLSIFKGDGKTHSL